MSTDVTIDQVIAKTREVAAEQPDFVYDPPEGGGDCVYLYGGEPSCIFGRVFVALGLGEPLAEMQQGDNPPIAGALNALGIPYGHAPEEWCAKVQNQQDAGVPWGEAVAEADAYIEGDR